MLSIIPLDKDDGDGTHESLLVHSEGDILGPCQRNIKILDLVIQSVSYYHHAGWRLWCGDGILDKEVKMILKILHLMKNEFCSAASKTSGELDGVAVLDWNIKNIMKGTASMLILFHGGKLLFIETINKNLVRSDWKESVNKSELLELETEEDFATFADEKHVDILGVTKYPKHLSYSFAQDTGRFSNNKEEDESECCWTCAVRVRSLEKSFCSGCRKARYCSVECLEGDWSVHGDWCQGRKGRKRRRR